MFEKAADYKDDRKVNLLLYGLSGAGKTTASSQVGYDPNDPLSGARVAYILSEGHHRRTVAQANPNARVMIPTHWDQLFEAYKYIRANLGEFDFVVLDSVGDLQEMLKVKVLKESGHDSPSVQEWGLIVDQTFTMLRRFRDLPQTVVFVCTAKEIEEEVSENRTRTLIRPNLVGKQSDKRLMSMVHAAGYAFVRPGEDGTIRRDILWLGSGERFLVKPAGALPNTTPTNLNLAVKLALEPSVVVRPEADAAAAAEPSADAAEAPTSAAAPASEEAPSAPRDAKGGGDGRPGPAEAAEGKEDAKKRTPSRQVRRK